MNIKVPESLENIAQTSMYIAKEYGTLVFALAAPFTPELTGLPEYTGNIMPVVSLLASVKSRSFQKSALDQQRKETRDLWALAASIFTKSGYPHLMLVSGAISAFLEYRREYHPNQHYLS